MKGGAIVIKVRRIRKQFRGGDQGYQRSKCWVGILAFKGNGWLQLLQKPGNLFPFRVLFIRRVFPDDISSQVGVNVTRKIVRCRYTSDGPWPLWLTLQLEILSTKHFPSVSIRQRLSCKTVCELQSLRCVAYRTHGGLLRSRASRRFLTGKTKTSCCMSREGPFITSYNFFVCFTNDWTQLQGSGQREFKLAKAWVWRREGYFPLPGIIITNTKSTKNATSSNSTTSTKSTVGTTNTKSTTRTKLTLPLILRYQLEVRENKMTEFVKGKVFTIAEVRENKDGQILAKVVSSTPELSRFL